MSSPVTLVKHLTELSVWSYRMALQAKVCANQTALLYQLPMVLTRGCRRTASWCDLFAVLLNKRHDCGKLFSPHLVMIALALNVKLGSSTWNFNHCTYYGTLAWIWSVSCASYHLTIDTWAFGKSLRLYCPETLSQVDLCSTTSNAFLKYLHWQMRSIPFVKRQGLCT